jgi:hypothetical protein
MITDTEMVILAMITTTMVTAIKVHKITPVQTRTAMACVTTTTQAPSLKDLVLI